MKSIDMIGKKFGRLLVQRMEPGSGKRLLRAVCVCDCGTVKSVRANALRTGVTTSCGCYRREVQLDMHTKHGLAGTRIYSAWTNMKTRCHNPKDADYKSYGGRGIQVCASWRNSFEDFYRDMGDVPEGRSLDRIDNDKGYSASNCRWATQREQSRNTRTNLVLSYQGRTQCVAAWADELGLARPTLYWRIKDGWPTDRAIEQPVRGSL